MALLGLFVMIAIVWALSDVLSAKTRAILGSAFIGFMLMLIGVWLKIFPFDWLDQSTLSGIGALSMSLVLVHMGSSMGLKELKAEWKTIVITVGGLISLLIIWLPLGSLLIGKEYTLTSLPVIFGGGVASMVLTSQLQESAISNAGVLIGFIWFLCTSQLLVGMPISLFALKKYSRRLVANDAIKSLEIKELAQESERKCIIPEKYRTPAILIAVTALLGLIGTFIGQYTNKYLFLHANIIMLLIGVAAGNLGLIPKNVLSKANSYGFLIFILYVYLSNLLTQYVTVETFIMLLKPIALTFLISVPIVLLGGFLMGKILKVDPWFSVALMSSCLSGFPMTITMSEEAAEVVGRTEEEKTILKKHLVPKMVVAGLFTVSFFSGVVASILGNFL